MFEQLMDQMIATEGAERSTMMGSACLRYQGEFVAMMFDKEDALIVKLPADRVNQLIADDEGREFNYTKKRFKEWVLIPTEREEAFEGYILEGIEFARSTHLSKLAKMNKSKKKSSQQ